MNKQSVNLLSFPNQAGTYIAQNDKIICLVQFVGWYPQLEAKRGLLLNNFMHAQDSEKYDDDFIKSVLNKKELIADKDVLNSIMYDRGKWEFLLFPVNYERLPIYRRTYSDFIKLTDYELLDLYSLYIKMDQSEISYTKMVSVIKVRCSCTIEAATKLINKFDRVMHGKESLCD